jgi:hypothetical protein
MRPLRYSITVTLNGLLLGLLSLACSPGAQPDVVVRDSAGVRIVENHVAAGSPLRLEPTPLIDIGPADGPQGEIANGPISAVRQRNGNIGRRSPQST